MGRETTIDSIQALDKRIEEVTAELIQLKRARNSSLTVARVPPEILGYIFRFNITTEVGGDPQFAGIQHGSYNFLLVCHHWFEVARRLPELWSFWGNSLEDWKRQLPLSGTAPLDLVLDGTECQVGSFGETMLDALKDYTTRNAVRKIHLRSDDIQLLTTIVSALTPDGWFSCDSNIESIALNGVDVTGLLSRRSYPKLRSLSLSGRFSLYSDYQGFLERNITTLVNLSLSSNALSSIQAASQILSLLTSNPNIRTLALESLNVKDDIRYGHKKPRVPLRHLKKLSLTGDFYYFFPILQQLELPERVDHARLEFSDCSSGDVEDAIVPYIRDYFRRDPRFEERLGIFFSHTENRVSLRASAIGVGYHGPDRLPQ